MRVLLWHGWLLEGSGSNIYAARTAEILRTMGHDVVLLCQEPHPEAYPWIDAWGTVGRGGPSSLESGDPAPGRGRCVLLRPEIGGLLPVFVFDEYEGFEVKLFTELASEELDGYLRSNVDALRAAARWHRSEAVITGHAIPGAAVAARALGVGAFAAKIHGSDLEYAVRPQPRYVQLANEGLAAARVVVGASSEVLERCRELVPDLSRAPMRAIPPGVDVERFRPRPRRRALLEVASLLRTDPTLQRGRPPGADEVVARALAARDADALDGLARSYDQEVPDVDAAAKLRALARDVRPTVGYFGKLIPPKGVDLLLAGAAGSAEDPRVLVIGFGLHREWLVAFDRAIHQADVEALSWLKNARDMSWDGSSMRRAELPHTTFTGRLDHRHAPGVLSAMDILVVPSILPEAFGMVAVEGAASGALPLVARHSGLAEVASAIEQAVDRPGLFSFEPGTGSSARIAVGIDRILSIQGPERDRLRQEVSRFVADRFSWRRTAERLLEAAVADGGS